MKVKEIESYVRQYAPVSLVLKIKKDSDVLDRIGFDVLLDGDNLALSTTLAEINRFLEGELPQAEPKWIRDGKVLSDSLSMADLHRNKDLHPNRTGELFHHQIELLRSKVDSATTFNDIDSIYEIAKRLCRQYRDHRDVMVVLETLQQDGFFDRSFTEAQRRRLSALCSLEDKI